MMTIIDQRQKTGSSNLLILMGSLWLALAAAVLFFQLTLPASITVEWETATELQTAGFNLYRSQSKNGEFVRINEALIPGEGSTTSGAAYVFTDKQIAPGETYFYMLEEIEYDATANRYDEDIFSHTVPASAWWMAALTAVSLLAGLSMLAMGIRERRRE
ncbi:MAG: hypothetical protein GY803_04625 [Chloroflexi bacterium]|nr:hypothetical protein [Chloroflexota bacterium]